MGPALVTGAMILPHGGAMAQVVDESEWVTGLPMVGAPDFAPDFATDGAPEVREQPAMEQAYVAPPPPAPVQQRNGYFIRDVTITGAETFSTADFGDVITPYLGQQWTEEDLRKLTQEITQSARDDGFVLAQATIPRQSLKDGHLTVELNQGRIDEVRIIGSDNQALANTLSPLTGRYAHKKEVERALLLAGDIPDIRVQKTRFVQEGGKNILEVTVAERGDTLILSADNYGTDRFGPVRLRATYKANALLSGSDTATIGVRTNPVDPKEFVYGSAGYEIGLGHNGTRLGVSGSIGNTQPGPGSSGFSEIEGDSRFVAAEITHPLVRANGGGIWVNAGASYLTIEQESLGVLLATDTQVTFTVGLNSNHKVAGGRLRGGVTYTRGAGLLGTTRQGDSNKSRSDGDGVFNKGTAFVQWSGPLWGNLGLSLSGYGQIANRPLLASQEISIGGAYSARGFDFSEISGETGVYGMAELNYTFRKPTSWLKQLQPYAFIDGGTADNIGTGSGSGSLLSAGMGMRARIGGFSLEVEGAAPINRDRDATGDKSPQVNVFLGVDI